MNTSWKRLSAVMSVSCLGAFVQAQSADDQLWPTMFPLDVTVLEPGVCAPFVYWPAPGHYPPDARIRTKDAEDPLFASLATLGLKEDQQTRIDKLRADLRRKNWELRGRVFDERDKLRAIFRAPAPDPQAVGKAYDIIFDLQREIIVNRVEATNKMLAVLTPVQRNQLRALPHRAPQVPEPPGGAAPYGAELPSGSVIGPERSSTD